MWLLKLIVIVNIVPGCIIIAHGKNYCSSKNCKNNKQRCKFQQSHNPVGHCVELETLIKNDTNRKALLNKINSRRNKVAAGELRSFPAASNMLKLEWNTTLELFAQRWANQCVRNSEPDIKDACRDIEGTSVGQNIATVYGESPGLMLTALVDIWYMELLGVNGSILPQFHESAEEGPHYDYFTQLVWADTSEVGCGSVKFKEIHDQDGHKNRTVYRLVCNFSPSGNRENQSVYSFGVPCSKCPEDTTCDSADYIALCSKQRKRNIQETNTTEEIQSLQNAVVKEFSTTSTNTTSDQINSTSNIDTESIDEPYTPFDYFSHLHEYTRQSITVTTTVKPACKDILAVDDFIDILRKKLSNDQVFKELVLLKTTQDLSDSNFTDASVAAFANKIYSKKMLLTTSKPTESYLLNSTLLVDLVEAVIFRSSDKASTNQLVTLSTIPMSNVSPIKIQAELGQLQQNDDFNGHYFFPEEDDERSTTENTDSYYDTPNLAISDIIMEIEDFRKNTVTRNFLDDILDMDSSTESTTAALVLSPDDMSSHKSGQEVMKKFLNDIKEKSSE